MLYVCSFISNHPTQENEHITNLELAKALDLDNNTLENYVVGLRTYVLKKFFLNIMFSDE